MKSLPLRAHEAAAYAAGRLTQIRRVVKPQPAFGCRYVMNAAGNGAIHMSEEYSDCFVPITGKTLPGKPHVLAAPYGVPGDRLALREGFALVPVSAYRCSEGVVQTANPDAETYEATIYRAGFDRSRGGIVWRSSTSMPLWAVRWHPVITAVRLERNDAGVWEWVIDVEGNTK